MMRMMSMCAKALVFVSNDQRPSGAVVPNPAGPAHPCHQVAATTDHHDGSIGPLLSQTGLAMKPFLLPSLAVFLTASVLSAAAQNADYFARYDGGWSGGGAVKIEQLPAPNKVSCKVDGKRADETSFSLAGTCRAMLVMSKKIGAELRLDPATGVYSGTYIGSSSGPARLVGKLKGDTLDLKVTWGRVIYDDNTARMLIQNSGGHSFRMQVVEKIDGKAVTVSDLSFQRG